MIVPGQAVWAQSDLRDMLGTLAQTVLEQQQAEHQRALWAGVVQNGSAAAYRQYLDTYPQGPNAATARAELAKLERGQAAAQVESRLALTQTQRMNIQRRLAALGHYRSGIDGVFGAGTRRAITAWQNATGNTATGYLTAEQSQTLLSGASAQPARPPASDGATTSPAQGELNLRLTRAQRVQIQRDLTTLGHDTRGVDGLFGSGTREAIRAWQRSKSQTATGYLTANQVAALRTDASDTRNTPAPIASAALDEDLLGLTRPERVEIQEQLIALGYLSGNADGIFGPHTRSAITRWQRDNGSTGNGYLTAEQVRVLR
ncbi:MAG: peptidoglycan-binding protein [Paracoccus sp. (in: a-proteobacteria)]|nr:peptidoglycan-binding protein [Paracoccus sp. (in: a-proteobacteria)]